MIRIQALRARWRRVDPRRKILAWAAAFAVLCGALDAGAPLEDFLRIGRSTLDPRTPSGQIVVIGVDDRSLKEVGQWPWPRRRYAEMLDRLRAMGVKRVFFDIGFSTPSNPVDDRLLSEALARYDGKVVLPVRFSTDRGGRTDLIPIREFRRHATLASIDVWYNFLGQVVTLPYSVPYSGRQIPSMAAEMTGSYGPAGKSFPIDQALTHSSMPLLSATDVLNGRTPAAAVRGKLVIIGPSSDLLGDIFLFSDRTYAPGVYNHALGAETLLRGRPVTLGWTVPLLAGLLGAFGYLFARRRWVGAVAAAGAGVVLLAGPLVAERLLIFSTIVPAMVALCIAIGSAELTRVRMALRTRGTTNLISGLPNLNALRAEAANPSEALIVASVRNYADVTAALPPDSERSLVEQIAARITVGGAAKIYQGDEGIFAWFMASGGQALGDQLNALHALFRSPIKVAGRAVDLNVTFGVEATARSTGNRLSSALVAAAEASETGLRWKAFDPARLVDADWRLSLLGQLDAAIDKGEIWVAYQPKLDLATRRITGAEALVRWSHPQKGEIAPQEFVLAAEQHGRIDRLTDYVLNQALRAATAVSERSKAFGIAVNVSARNLDDDAIVARVEAALKRNRIAPECLTLEITESAAMASSRSFEVLERLRALGVGISVDDYGTGMSTLEYLKTVPATEIKIDRRFVSAIAVNHSDRMLVASTIQLAHSLGRKVVAEGVETQETLDDLAALGCDKAQGYLIGRPMKLPQLLRAVMTAERRIAA